MIWFNSIKVKYFYQINKTSIFKISRKINKTIMRWSSSRPQINQIRIKMKIMIKTIKMT